MRKSRYKRVGSKFTRKYRKTRIALSEELNVSMATLTTWDSQGFDVFKKAKELNSFRGNKTLHALWQNMKSRCGNPDDKKYKFYGGKGVLIRMTKEDLAFLWERDKAGSMNQPSIDRINTAGHYEADNCRFIEMQENRKWKKHLTV